MLFPRPIAIRGEPARVRSINWTMGLIDVVERQAKAGHLGLLGDLCDDLLGDDRIGALLRTRAESLFGVVPSFEGSGDGRRKGRAVKALEADEDWWAMTPEPESAIMLKYGLLAGVCPGQLDWWERVDGRLVARVKEGRNVPSLHHWSVSTLAYDLDRGEWTVELKNGARAPFCPGNGQDLLFSPFTTHRPWLHGIWRGLARWWVLKHYAMVDFGRLAQRSAGIVVEADVNTPSSKPQRQEIANLIVQLSNDGALSLPPGYVAKLMQAAASSHEIFVSLIDDLANEAFAIAILGHNLTSKVDGGSHAAANVGQEVKLELRSFDAESWTTFTHAQVLPAWSSANFGTADLAPWAVFNVKPPVDRAARALELKTLGEALIKLSDEVDERKVLENFEVPLLTPEQVAAKKEAAAALAPPVPPAGQPPGAAPDPDAAPAADKPATPDADQPDKEQDP